MPRTRSLAWSELKIGILAVVAVAIASSVIFLLSNRGGFFWQRYTLKARFASVPGLKPGAPVRVAGVEVGTVSDIAFVGTDVEVAFDLSKSMQPRITTDSRAAIGSLSLLGQSTVDVTPAVTGTPIAPWGYVRTSKSPGQLTDFAEVASTGLEEATKLLQEIRGGRGTIGRLFTDDEIYREFETFVATAQRVTSGLESGHGTIGQLMVNPAAYRSLQASLESLNQMINRINAGEGSLGRLLKDERLATSLTSVSARADALAGRLERGEGTAGKLLNDAALYDRLTATATRLDDITTRLGQGQGTAGQLLQDKRLYENMSTAAGELRDLIAEIRKNPKKFLSVRLTVF
jgi:phospholipid/cholesterol/gamma-HCH transport system substrate-binding protein